MILWPCFCAAAVAIVPGMRRFGDRSERLYDMFALIGFFAQLLLAAFLMTEDISISVPLAVRVNFRYHGLGSIMCLIVSAMCLLLVPVIRAYSGISPSVRGKMYSLMLLSLSISTCVFTAADYNTLALFLLLIIPFSVPMIKLVFGEHNKIICLVYVLSSVFGDALMYAGVRIIEHQIGAVNYSTVYTFSSLVSPPAMSAAMLHILGGMLIYSAVPLIVQLVFSSGNTCLYLASGVFSFAGGMYTVTMAAAGLTAEKCAVTVIVSGGIIMCASAIIAIVMRDIKKTAVCIGLSVCGEVIFSIGAYTLTGNRNALSAVILSVICGCILLLLANMTACCAENAANSTSIGDMTGIGRGKAGFTLALVSLCFGYSSIPSWNGYVTVSLLCDSLGKGGYMFYTAIPILFSGLSLAVGMYMTVKICVKVREGSACGVDFHPVILIPAAMLPMFGILPSLFTSKTLNYILSTFKAGKIDGIRFFNGELLTGAFISLVIGTLICAVIRDKN